MTLKPKALLVKKNKTKEYDGGNMPRVSDEELEKSILRIYPEEIIPRYQIFGIKLADGRYHAG